MNAETLVLEAPRPTAPKPGSCRLWEPTRNPATGRVLTSKPGKCKWQIKEWPEKWPAAYRKSEHWSIPWRDPPKPTPREVFPYDCEKCPTREAKP